MSAMDHHRMKIKPSTAETYNETVYRPRNTKTAMDSNGFEFESDYNKSPR
jgi:hypothetical protein